MRNKFFDLFQRYQPFSNGYSYIVKRCISDRPASNVDYCINIVRKYDYENYLCTLLLPKTVIPAAFVLRAFNVEIAQVRDVVSDEFKGVMRMTFWKDAVEDIYKGKPPATPVALELEKVIKRHNLPKHWFTKLIETRFKQLSDRPFTSLQHLEEYSENTAGSLLYLLLQCGDIKNVQADHAASHIGKCQGIITVLRGLPYNASKGIVYLPVDILAKHNVSQEDIKRGKDTQNVKDAVHDIASLAHQHLKKAQSMKEGVPESALFFFLGTVMCDKYLKNLQIADFNVFHSKLQSRDNLLPWRLLVQKFRRTY